MNPVLRDYLRSGLPYLAEAFVRSRVALGGGATIIVAGGIYQVTSSHPLAPPGSVIVFLLAMVFAQLWHGLKQFRQNHPRFVIWHPKQQLWDELGRRGVGYCFEISNPSNYESLESVKDA